MKRSVSKSVANDEGVKGICRIDWELRPGGMLVQKRHPLECFPSPMIKIKVSHGSYHHEVTVPAQSTFGIRIDKKFHYFLSHSEINGLSAYLAFNKGHLKKLLKSETGLEPKEQRLLFRGKEKEDEECLHMVGVTNMSKVLLLEDPASKERKIEEIQRSEDVLKAFEAVTRVRTEVDKLYQKVVNLETSVRSGSKVEEKEFVILTELLMVQLLKLDSIAADEDAKVQRRIEVSRVQSYVDIIEKLKARNSTSVGNAATSNAVAVISNWEPFESGTGSLKSAIAIESSTVITQEWEHFE